MLSVLHTYLILHKSLSVPGLGTIYVERTPAQSDFVNKQIIPPSYHYRFDRYFDSPDKEFFHFLASRKNIAEYEAIRWYNDWAADLRETVRNNQPVELPEVGRIMQDETGEIHFEPFANIASGLEPVAAERLIRINATHQMIVGEKETTSAEMSRYYEEQKVVEKESWWIYALIIGAISLIAIFFHFYKHGNSVESTGNYRSINTE